MRYKIKKRYRDSNPWVKHQDYIANRLRYSKYYRGRKSTLTCSQLKIMWFRDKAYEMQKPTVDRIDDKQGYVFENCRFMEHGANLSKRFRGRVFSRKHKEKLSKSARKRWV